VPTRPGDRDDDRDREFPDSPRADYAPTGASTGTGLLPTLKRTFKEFSEDHMTDWAASLTYYGLLSIFPAIIAMVSIVGIFGDPQSTTRTLTTIVNQVSPGTAGQTFGKTIRDITSNRGASGVLLIVGIAGAIWSASGYVGAFSRAANVVVGRSGSSSRSSCW
jgi:membrane protein